MRRPGPKGQSPPWQGGALAHWARPTQLSKISKQRPRAVVMSPCRPQSTLADIVVPELRREKFELTRAHENSKILKICKEIEECGHQDAPPEERSTHPRRGTTPRSHLHPSWSAALALGGTSPGRPRGRKAPSPPEGPRRGGPGGTPPGAPAGEARPTWGSLRCGIVCSWSEAQSRPWR
jgi:hypothetical protein